MWLGLIVPNPEAAGGLFAVAFPLTMISSIFVAPQLMPDWLGAVASWVEQHALLMAYVWPVILTAIFLPLAVRRFQKLSG